MVDRDIVLPSGLDSLDDVVAVAQRAESLGYDRLSLPEVTGRDGVTLLATLAARTDRIGLSNDVFSPWGRSPAMLGQTGVTVQEASGGRYRMGLGTSSPNLTEGWHLAAYERPLRRLRETIDIIRQVTAGEELDYDGDHFDGGGLRLRGVEPRSVPVDVAALGPKAVELAGRFADGWVPQLFTVAALEDRLEDLRRGAALGDRSTDDLRVAVTVRSCALEDASRARTAARKQLAFMVGAYGPYYRQSIARQGFEAATDDIHGAWTDGDRQRAIEAVTEEMVDSLVAAGTPEAVRETVRRYEAVDGVDAVRIGYFGDMDADERRQTTNALAPSDG
ncbi:probable F420-dependent oxidoreductase [Natronomonas pharaonis DSM 2160]|uniref:Probable F420-dependent oxidoreductase n=1 Tax=Natronomonas pharaonis (strain ATCC 35678 / DSM 2160 / CIP 103997 / JCM 8858 / NBRC 14720 / NCIMB 2260 / Gabara) TaxID=348780 RepID=A0A1U7EYH2_NATPD|nr:TIGR04024 family LLM class F420-dependent oxidoreductase [Natronomonas pharaonis]CAI50278.1 probable F420-dependent oxidoreductase [Natronomonas pharaonis DSM 2160]